MIVAERLSSDHPPKGLFGFGDGEINHGAVDQLEEDTGVGTPLVELASGMKETRAVPGGAGIASAIANPMPKSAFCANNQAKACAAAIVALLRGREVPAPALMNTCYSLVAPDYGISIAAVYRVMDDKLAVVPGSSGVSPLDAPGDTRLQEAEYARSRYANITADVFT